MHVGIFLDRDGTINEEVNYVRHPDELKLIPQSADAIREANNLGFRVFVISNQSGVARGMFTEEQLASVHERLQSLLSQNNAHIDAIYYCPHHPDFGEPPYRRPCDCRKPAIGMLERAVKEFDIDLSKSYVIGDRVVDIETGNNAGASSILVLTGYGREERNLLNKNHVQTEYIADDLYGAMQHIKSKLLRACLPTS